jgi:hypothetical protein
MKKIFLISALLIPIITLSQSNLEYKTTEVTQYWTENPEEGAPIKVIGTLKYLEKDEEEMWSYLGEFGLEFAHNEWKDGVWKVFYESGKIKWFRYYENGIRVVAIRFTKEGKENGFWSWHNGQKNGVWKKRCSNGQLTELTNWDMGTIISQKCWDCKGIKIQCDK